MNHVLGAPCTLFGEDKTSRLSCNCHTLSHASWFTATLWIVCVLMGSFPQCQLTSSVELIYCLRKGSGFYYSLWSLPEKRLPHIVPIEIVWWFAWTYVGKSVLFCWPVEQNKRPCPCILLCHCYSNRLLFVFLFVHAPGVYKKYNWCF